MDLIKTFKILTRKCNVNCASFFSIASTGHLRDNSLNLFKGMELRKHFFSQRVLEVLNMYPNEVVMSESFSKFKNFFEEWMHWISALKRYPCSVHQTVTVISERFHHGAFLPEYVTVNPFRSVNQIHKVRLEEVHDMHNVSQISTDFIYAQWYTVQNMSVFIFKIYLWILLYISLCWWYIVYNNITANIVPANQCQKAGLETVYESNLHKCLRNKDFESLMAMLICTSIMFYIQVISINKFLLQYAIWNFN